MTFASLQGWLAAHLPQGRVARSIITLASGTAVAQLITICAMPIVTRLYTPAQIGVVSLFLAFFGFWAATLSLRYEYALLIASDDEESHAVHRLAIILVAMMSILGLPVLWGLHHFGILGFSLLPWWAPFATVPILLGYGMFMVYRSWALRAGLVKQITKAAVARAGARVVTQLGLGLFGGGVVALFAAELTGAWGALLGLANATKRRFSGSPPRSTDRKSIVLVARKFAKFPLLETPSTWVDQLGVTLPLPMIAAMHGPVAAGWFGLARMIVGVPNAQIGSAVADVFQMELANAVVAGDVSQARSLFYKLMRKLSLLGLVPLVVVVTLAPLLVPWIFGNAWKQAGFAAAAIAPWLYAALVVSPLSRTLSVLQAQEYKLIYDVSAVLLFVAAFVASKAYDASFLYSVLAISAAGVAGYVIYAALLIAIVETRLHLKAP